MGLKASGGRVSLCAPEGINQQDGVCDAAKTETACQVANAISVFRKMGLGLNIMFTFFFTKSGVALSQMGAVCIDKVTLFLRRSFVHLSVCLVSMQQ